MEYSAPSTFLGVPMLGLAPSDRSISDNNLQQQILTVGRINYFLLANEGVEIKPTLMRQNYGLLLCGNEIAPLVEEARARASQGSPLFNVLFEVIDEMKATRGRQNEPDDAFVINEVDRIKRKLPSGVDIPIKPETANLWLPEETSPQRPVVSGNFFSFVTAQA